VYTDDEIKLMDTPVCRATLIAKAQLHKMMVEGVIVSRSVLFRQVRLPILSLHAFLFFSSACDGRFSKCSRDMTYVTPGHQNLVLD